jgi:hypothetical protein
VLVTRSRVNAAPIHSEFIAVCLHCWDVGNTRRKVSAKEESMSVDVPAAGLGRRFKVRFPDADHYNAAQAFETARSRVPVRSAKRNFISIELPPALQGISEIENTLDTQLKSFEEYFGATVVEDYRFDLEESTPDIFDPSNFGPESPNDPVAR